MAKSNPELAGILAQASKEQWTTDRFLMTVANTNWWKTNGQAVREWTSLQATDPQTARDRQGHITGDIYARASAMGINLSPQQAEQAFYFIQFSGGMSDQNINDYLGRTFFNAYDFDWQKGTGKASEYAQQLDQMRHAYGMPDGQEFNWVRDELNAIMQGGQTIDGARLAAISYAKSKYSQFSERLEGGETMMDIARPYVDTYSKILETAPNAGLDDSLIQKALQARGADGKPAEQPTWKFEETLRQDPRWAKTDNAKEWMGNFVTKVGTDMGFFR
ncbi:MAG: hypothetical protein ACRDSH_13050 [Pseudonocardiaceae bacterium]